jgi:hypothetical protein
MSFGDFIFSAGLFQKREKGGLNCIKRTKLVCDETYIIGLRKTLEGTRVKWSSRRFWRGPTGLPPCADWPDIVGPCFLLPEASSTDLQDQSQPYVKSI